MENIALQTGESQIRETGPAQVHRQELVWTLVFAVAAAGASSAFAVDITNRDRLAREVTINHSDGRSEVITVGAGQRIANVCSDCVVLATNSSVEVQGTATVKIERGEVSIDRKR